MSTITAQAVEIRAGKATIAGILGIPENATGVVLFAHGSGSGRFSSRNQFVSGQLRRRGIATFLMDLLDTWEADDRRKVFDIDLLADRLLAATEWVQMSDDTRDLNVGYFGASTGAGAALQAAARLGDEIGAVVSRGGRPDLAADYLPGVAAPTLLVVGGDDTPVIGMNREAYEVLRCTKEMVIVPGATHLFEEPGKLEEVARLAEDWFIRHLGSEQTG